MPTKDWFQKNPRVAAYIPKELHKKLEDWMKANKIRNFSQALNLILEKELGDSPPENQLSNTRLDLLEEKIDRLAQEMKELQAMLPKEIDRKTVMAEIENQMLRIGWDANRGKAHLKSYYRKVSRDQLNQTELLDFLEFLKKLPDHRKQLSFLG